MSPKYFLALVLALALFLTATSLTDDLKPKSRNQPSTALDNKLTHPKTKPPGNGKGHNGGGSNNNELAANVNSHKGHGPDPKEPHVNEEAVFINNRKSKAGEYHVAKDPSIHGSKHRPGDPTGTRFNENKGKKNKPGGLILETEGSDRG